jgi:hypothetical protein
MGKKTLTPDTSKIISSYALPETLTFNDVYFLTREWTKINNVNDFSKVLFKFFNKNSIQLD